MAERGNVGVGLSATALVAGLLTGTFLRPAPPPSELKPVAAAPAPVHLEGEVAASPLKQLRPVMELLGQSLGVDVDPAGDVNAANAALADWDGKEPARGSTSATLEQLLTTVNSGCDDASDLLGSPADSSGGSILQALVRVGARAGDLRSDAVPKTLLAKVLLADLESCADRTALSTLAHAAADAEQFDVRFLIATLPDYVDSSSGWRADQVIDGIQSAMSDGGYVLDRFKLIDWVRTNRQSNEVMSSSRLHETQPGALIFRRRHGRILQLEVVLLVLETPTSGVHRGALHNAIAFLAAWNDTMTRATELKVVGPGFSGSIASLALELGSVDRDPSTAHRFARVSVVSSATADENASMFHQLAPTAAFSTTSRPSSQAIAALREALGRMNGDWYDGRHVAMLVESNTAFGRDYGRADVSLCSDQTSDARDWRCDAPELKELAWKPDSQFPFPLHIAELMADLPPASAAVSLLPSSVAPLTLRETIPPADQIPSLRPQLTSAIVENQMNGILDNIEHEGITAVGIVATDERDVLFIARLLKRQAPNVQLFFAFNNLLYLHSDYLPYIRGALVASTYPLYVPGERDAYGPRKRRLFESMTAEAVYNATQVQLDTPAPVAERLRDYCDPGLPDSRSCVPPVWVSIVGDDGFWPLSWQAFKAGPLFVAAGPFANLSPDLRLLPITGPMRVIAALLLAVIAAHAGLLLYAWLKLKRPEALREFQRSLFLRVLAPPVTYEQASRRHAFALVLGFAVLAVLSMWVSSILQFHGVLQHGWPASIALIGTVLSGGLAMTPAVLVARRSRQYSAAAFLPVKPLVCCENGTTTPANGDEPVLRAPTKKSSYLMFAAMVLLLCATLASFLVFLAAVFVPVVVGSAGSDTSLAIALDRFASGSIVSPAPAILCLFAAMYAAIFTGLRRISLLGSGYAALAAESATFRLIAGAPLGRDPRSGDPRLPSPKGARHLPLVCLLDMPAQNLSWPYPVGLMGLLLMILWAVSWPHTIDGGAFSWFLACSSAFVLASAFLLLAQAIEVWRRLRPGLITLSHSRLEPVLASAAKVVRWNLSLVSPHLSDLEPLASLADRLHGRLLVLASGGEVIVRNREQERLPANIAPIDYAAVLHDLLDRRAPGGLLRRRDLDGPAALARPCQVAELHKEIEQQEYAPLLQSRTWFYLWGLSDQLVRMLQRVHWSRCEPLISDASTLSERRRKDDRATDIAGWMSDCETLVALQCALVLRDILARVMSCLFTAMLCLTLMTAAHLFYMFQGRSSFLTVDLIAVACAAGVAIWLLVAMERDTVLSRLRHTVPGRVDFNWEFLKRVGLYGALPLVAVLSSLFPEIQGPLFGWLEPLRKLVNF